MIVGINDYDREEHNRALCEDDYNVSRTSDTSKVHMFYRIHNSTEILFCEEGEADYFIKGKLYRISAGDILVIGALNHHERIINSLPYIRYGLTLMPSYVRSFIFDINLLRVFETLPPEEHERRCRNIDPDLFSRLISLLNDLYSDTIREDSYSVLDRRLLVQQIAITMHRAFRYDDSEAIQDSYQMDKMKKIHDYIDTHFHEDISLELLSDMFYLHPTNISKYFHKCYGTTISKYINAVRICKAQQLLETSEMSMSAIANLVGFTSVNQFITKYKSILAKTPLQYRKEYRSYKMNGEDSTIL